jgi:L-rhamnose mutarotase
MTKLDAKFYGQIRKAKDDTVVPEDQYMVFLAKDNAFPATLVFYYYECQRLGADAEHLAAVERTVNRLQKWREENADLLKVPDAHGEKLLDQ